MGFASMKRKKLGALGGNRSDTPSTTDTSRSVSLKRELEAVGTRVILSLPSVNNNCAFQVLALALLLLPPKLRAGQRLRHVASALAPADLHKALDESERREFHELAQMVEDDVRALNGPVTAATGAVVSAQHLDLASPLEIYPIDSTTPAGKALVMLSDASTPHGARFARLLRLLRLAAAAAVYKRPNGGRCASARGGKSRLPPDVVDAKTEGRRVSGEVLDALLGVLGYSALLLTSDATIDETHRTLLGPAAGTAAPFIGTLLLGMEDAHYKLILTSRTALHQVPNARAAIATVAADDKPAAGGAAIGAGHGRAGRLKSAADIERWLHKCAARDGQRDEASNVLARMHAFGPSRSLLPWARGGGRKAKGRASSSASPGASDESSTGPDGPARRVK
eukprot:jgi/Chrpa1/21947/Chrysochromulina_OHIO_Genome00026452-RA